MLTRYRRNTPSYPATVARDPFFNFVDRFFNDTGWSGLPAETGEQGWVPAMDIVENDDAYVATADLPGLTKDDIEISVEDGMLSISGERKIEHSSNGDEKKGFKRLERAWGSFRRSFTLPQGVDLEKVKAAFSDGVLQVTLPKSEIVKARKVSIS